jgi:hypothetical protein
MRPCITQLQASSKSSVQTIRSRVESYRARNMIPLTVVPVGWCDTKCWSEFCAIRFPLNIEVTIRCTLSRHWWLTWHFIHSSMALKPSFFGPWPLLQFRNLFYAVGRIPWTGDEPVARPLPTHRTIQTQNKRTHRHPYLKWDSNPRSQCSSNEDSSWLRQRGHRDRNKHGIYRNI